MDNYSTKAIQAWFAEHDGDGEFCACARAFPYSVIGPADAMGSIIFTTKPKIVSAIIHEDEARHGFGVVGWYGLPNEADLGWIRKVIGQRPVLFLGDLDPVDLLVFAWFRSSLGTGNITHVGLSDAFLKALELPLTQSLVFSCTPSEGESLGLLRTVLPDLRETVGHECARCWSEGTSWNSKRSSASK